MRKRKQGGGETPQPAATTEAAPLRPDERKGEGTEDEVELVEVPSDHWLIKRRWKIVKRKKGKDEIKDGGAKEEEEEENDEDTEYEYEVDKRRALIFFATRLLAVLVVFLVLHTLFYHFVWDPLTRTRETPMEEQIRRFRELGQL